MIVFVEFLLMGLGIGIFGTMVGAGGGFILTPLLLLLFPDRPAEIVTATSLSVVALNALSGSIAYYRLRRIDIKTALVYSLAAAPWVVLGVFTTSSVKRGPFDILLGLGLLALCISLFRGSDPPPNSTSPEEESDPSLTERHITDRSGRVYHYRFRYKMGIWMSTGIGFFASFFGIGGGPIYVPLMIRALRVPVHIATATCQFLLLINTTVAVLVHYFRGNLHTMSDVILPLAFGVICGAQIGAAVSGKMKSGTITKIFVILLALISFQLLYQGFTATLN